MEEKKEHMKEQHRRIEYERKRKNAIGYNWNSSETGEVIKVSE